MIRSATLEDVDRVVALVESAYRGEKSRAGWTTEADMLEGQRTDAREVRAIIEAFPKQRVLLLEEGALRACARLDDAEGHAYLGMIAVEGTQENLLDLMQTREELYDLLDYDPAHPEAWLAKHSEGTPS